MRVHSTNIFFVKGVDNPTIRTAGKKILEDLRLDPSKNEEILVKWSVGLLHVIPEIKISITGIFGGQNRCHAGSHNDVSDLFTFPKEEIVITRKEAEEGKKPKIIYSETEFAIKIPASIKPGYYFLCCEANYDDCGGTLSGNFKFRQKLIICYN